jgi:hypothetical protein
MNPNFQRDFQRGLNEIGFWDDLYSWQTLATLVVYFILGVGVGIADTSVDEARSVGFFLPSSPLRFSRQF